MELTVRSRVGRWRDDPYITVEYCAWFNPKLEDWDYVAQGVIANVASFGDDFSGRECCLSFEFEMEYQDIWTPLLRQHCVTRFARSKTSWVMRWTPPTDGVTIAP